MKCVTSYPTALSAVFWVVVYLLSLSVGILVALIIYDLVVADFSVAETGYVLVVLCLFLAAMWALWRRGLFLSGDFRQLIEEMGGAVSMKRGILQGKFDGVLVEAKFGRYLRGGAPFPSWHQSNERQRPCADPECMLCDSRFLIKMTDRNVRTGGKKVLEQELVGGTWEGIQLRRRLQEELARVRSQVGAR